MQLPTQFFFCRGVTESKTELTPSLSCCVVSSSRWEAVASVAAIYICMIFSAGITLGVTA